MNGFEFIQAVRADDTWTAMRIIMVTTESEIEKMTKALEAGANEYIMKPFTKDAIRDKLQLLGVIG
jgi:two-component system chemotaxis response regulator CheY